MSESVTNVDLNFSNGGGGHTATVTSIVGAVSAETYEDSLGEIAGDAGEKSLFSDSRIDDLMSRFVETEMTTSADPTKKTKVRKYIDSTSIKLNSYVVLVRGINAPIQGDSSFEGSVSYFSEVKGTAVPSFGASGPTKGANNTPVIILGNVYNMESSNLNDGNATSVNLIYQSKELKGNLSLRQDAVPQEYLDAPDPSKYSLKFGYTVNEFKKALEIAGVEQEGLDPDFADDVLFEASGPLMGVVGSVAAHFGFFYYIDPTNGKLKFINSALASQLSVTDPTNTTDESVIAASFTKSAINESIVNSYAGTAEKMDKSGMAGGDGDDDDGDELYSTFLSKVEVDKFHAFKIMRMNMPELGAYFQIFNQDQPPEMFDKYTYALTWLSQRNVKQNNKDYEQSKKDGQYLIVNGKRYVMTLHGAVEYKGQRGGEVDKVWQPLYLPRPLNLEMWSWGPDITEPATQVIWAGSDARIKSNERDLAKRADKGHQFQRYSGGASAQKSLANYIALAYEKSDAELDWEGVDGEKKLMPMPKPSQSPLYEFLKNYFAIAGGVYVSHGYGRKRAMRMGFENSNQITVSGPFHAEEKIREFKELNQLTSFFKILGIERDVTVGDLADLTNKEAKTVNPFHFIAVRNIPKLSLRAQLIRNGNKKPFDAGMPANFGPLGTHCEIYDKPNELNGISRYLGGPLLNVKFQQDRGGKRLLFAKYINDLVNRSITAYRATGAEMGINRAMTMHYTLHDEEIHSLGDNENGDDLIADNNVEVDPERGERFDHRNQFDQRFYDVVAAPTKGLTKPTLSAASGNTKEMKTLRDMRGDSQTSSGPKLTTSSKTIYGLYIPNFSPTLSSLSISVGDGGIQTTIGKSTIKIIPPDQQFLIGQGVEAAHGKGTESRLAAHQKNHFGL